MKLIEKKENQIVFSSNIEESLANAIRRYTYEIPILAIDEVEIFKNDSALYDETLSHRLGLIPLKMEGSFDEKKEIKLKLVAKGAGMILSEEIKGPVEPIYKNIPIVSLNTDQELEMIATARLGKGKEHSKFSPGLVFYRNVPEIKISKECNNCMACIEVCPRGVLKADNKKIIVEDVYKCDMCGVCLEKCKYHQKDAIVIAPTDELVITVESFGQIKSKDIIVKAIKELKKDLNEVEKKISK